MEPLMAFVTIRLKEPLPLSKNLIKVLPSKLPPVDQRLLDDERNDALRKALLRLPYRHLKVLVDIYDLQGFEECFVKVRRRDLKMSRAVRSYFKVRSLRILKRLLAGTLGQ